MFDYGDKVVCINNDNISDLLTIGKIYEIVRVIGYMDTSGSSIPIIDDHGVGCGFFERRFVSLKEYRKEKLQKICLK